MIRWWLAVVLTVVGVACGGTQRPEVQEAPKVPVPPTEPLAWMPEDAALVGRAVLAPLRGTPLWDLWTKAVQVQPEITGWIDMDRVDEVTLSGAGIESAQPSFVAVVKGRFGEGYLEQVAQAKQLSGEARGLLRVYVTPEAGFAQLNPELLLVASPDRLSWLVARAEAGPGEPIRDSLLFRSLAERLAFEQSSLSLLVDDPEGKGRERVARDARSYGLRIPDDLLRAGVSAAVGPQVTLAAVAEAAAEEGARSVRDTVERSLSGLASNMLVAMFGLRPLVTAFHAEAQGAHVVVRGSVSQEDLFSALGKLQFILDMAATQRASAQEP
jgi:hypothetical protein